MFFPSYGLLDIYMKAWEYANIQRRIEVISKKKVFVECSDQAVFKDKMKRFRDEISEMKSGANTGALLIGVCRGKLSEGIDFSDDAARAVIVFGIPFPNYQDPKVILKRHFLDSKKADATTAMSGMQWYQLEATRTVN